MEKWIAGLFLLICSITDVRKKEIPISAAVVFGLGGIAAQLVGQMTDVRWWVLGGLAGAALMGIGCLTGEAIGYGDGLAVGVAGIWLGLGAAVEILFVGLCMSAVVCAVLLAAGRVKKKHRIPFLPFLAAAWVVWMLMGSGEVAG